MPKLKCSKTAIARVLGPELIGEKFINLTGFVKILLGTVLFHEIHMMEIIFGVFGVLESCFCPQFPFVKNAV